METWQETRAARAGPLLAPTRSAMRSPSCTPATQRIRPTAPRTGRAGAYRRRPRLRQGDRRAGQAHSVGLDREQPDSRRPRSGRQSRRTRRQARSGEAALDGASIRELSRARRELVDSLVKRALDQAGQRSPSVALRDEVTDTFNAALADPDLADQVAAGTLQKAVHWAGFGPGIGSAVSSGPARAPATGCGRRWAPAADGQQTAGRRGGNTARPAPTRPAAGPLRGGEPSRRPRVTKQGRRPEPKRSRAEEQAERERERASRDGHACGGGRGRSQSARPTRRRPASGRSATPSRSCRSGSTASSSASCRQGATPGRPRRQRPARNRPSSGSAASSPRPQRTLPVRTLPVRPCRSGPCRSGLGRLVGRGRDFVRVVVL